MKTQIQNLLQIGRFALLRRRMTSWLFLPNLIALALLGLAIAPGLATPPTWIGGGWTPDQLLYEFPEDDFSNSNELVSVSGSGALCVLAANEPPSLLGSQFRAPSTGGSSNASTLFGTASVGGSSGYGTVFSVNTDGTGFTVLHHFTGGSDGNFPAAGLILSSNTLYGTTENGGNVDDGVIFALDTSGTNFTVLHHFSARYYAPYTNNDGGNPTAALILSGNTLYGTASDGGSANDGTVFALNLNNTNFTVLHSFAAANYDANFNLTNRDGANPNARLLLSGGTLYGTTTRGGTGGQGAVFAVGTNGMGFTNLYSFTAVDPFTLTNRDGANPQAGLILSGNMLYGTAFRGGNSTIGTVFAVNTNGTFFTNLYSFTGGSDGAEPAGELMLLTNMLIGTTSIGGDTSLNGGNGTVFALNTNGTDFTVLYRFTAGNYDSSITGNNLTNSDGANPRAGLIYSGGTLYGTASDGGSGANGTVFSLSLQPASQVTILGVTLSGTNLIINGTSGQSGGTNVTLMSTNLLLSLNKWTPVATNVLNVTGNFIFTATNAVDPKAPRRFYILQTQ